MAPSALGRRVTSNGPLGLHERVTDLKVANLARVGKQRTLMQKGECWSERARYDFRHGTTFHPLRLHMFRPPH